MAAINPATYTVPIGTARKVLCGVTGHLVMAGHGPECHQNDRRGPAAIVTTSCPHRV